MKHTSTTLFQFFQRIPLLLRWALIFIIVIAVIALAYNMPGWGFGTYVDAKGEIVPMKTFWDWLSLLIVPLILAVGGIAINSTIQRGDQKRSEERERREKEQAEKRADVDRQIADNHLKEQALQTYLDRMSELLLNGKFDDSSTGEKARAIARARTLTTLLELNGGRRGVVLQFLYASGLIKGDSAIDLNRADFRNAGLAGAYLVDAHLVGAVFYKAMLGGAHLEKANLSWAILIDSRLVAAHLEEANLSRAYLPSANLSRAYLPSANLSGAFLDLVNFSGASLEGANLQGADLRGADFRSANLTGAKITQEQLDTTFLDESTTLPDGSHPKAPSLPRTSAAPQPPTVETPPEDNITQKNSP